MRHRMLILVCLLLGLAAPVRAQEVRSARASYILHCSGCHGMTGLGTEAGGIPTFPGSVGHIARSEVGRTYITHVPGVIGTDMDDAQIAEVLNYILEKWGEGALPYSADEVTRRRAIPVGDVVILRREVVEDLRKTGIEIAEYPWP